MSIASELFGFFNQIVYSGEIDTQLDSAWVKRLALNSLLYIFLPGLPASEARRSDSS